MDNTCTCIINPYTHTHKHSQVSLISEKHKAADFCRSTLSEKDNVYSDCNLSSLNVLIPELSVKIITCEMYINTV